MSTITSHVLDTTSGKPADGLVVILEIARRAGPLVRAGRAVTDSAGRIAAFDPPRARASVARRTGCDLRTGAYFAATHVRTFYPEVHVVVEIDDPSQHYHIPLLVSPFGYSTYRGS